MRDWTGEDLVKMKISVIPVALLVASAAAGGVNTVSQKEANDWYSCTNHGLNMLNEGHDDTRVTCAMLRCLTEYANEYNRGGLSAKLANILKFYCTAADIPFIGQLL
ncbi:hypothetical protein BDV25DRAFT_139498 [Aspergillus avenaceus]|uniref:Uncharacterized protein n=1 Tax=Aspergillus avenaceus TaxID=36643 RepID=A0A5N6TWQ6_ASPAV|nr:hypothetical protein BDV25DRAFT_139498 [Aspergillus avenaceus]